MKKIYLSMLAWAALSFGASAQVFSDGFESWNNNVISTPTNWMGSKTNIVADSVIRVTTGAYTGTNAVKLLRRTSQNRRFTSQPFAITQGTFYQIKFYAQGKGDVYSGLWTGKSGSTFGYLSDGTYETVNVSGSWWVYTDYVLADTSNNNAEVVFWIRNTVPANGDLSLDEVTVTSISPLAKSIYDIQYSTAVNGDSPEKNKLISTNGIVTAKSTFGYFIQDGTGAWNGLYVDDRNNTAINLGDNITVVGVVKESFGQTILTSVLQKTVNSTGNALPASLYLGTNDVKQEKYEGVLVKVGSAVCIAAPNQFNEWTVDDGSGSVKINSKLVSFLYELSL